MSPESGADETLGPTFEALSVSKRLVRSVSQKLKKKWPRGDVEEEDDFGSVSLKCLTLHGRGGGCKVGADTSEELGDPTIRRKSSACGNRKGYKAICGIQESGFDCFSYGVKEKLWKKNNRKYSALEELIQNSRMNIFLPDDILEMCLVRLPLVSLMNARLVCKKWRYLISTPRFLQMRLEGSHQTPWLFLFGAVKNSYCSGYIYALDVAEVQWHKINADILKGRFMFSVASAQDNVFIVGGCSSLSNFGRVDRSSFKTHRDVFVFSPLTKSWREVASMKYARSMPILGISEVSIDFCVVKRHQIRQDRHSARTRGGASDVYADPHRLSLRRQHRNSFDENEHSLLPSRKSYRSTRQRGEFSDKSCDRKFVLISVGGLGSWDEPLDSGEIYDPISNKWTEIQRLPLDFGVVCSGVVCNEAFYVYSEADKLAGYDLEKGFWIGIETAPVPPRVLEYYPKLVSCNGQLFMLSVSWCEGDGQIGRRNKAVRKLWELDLMYLSWVEVSVHPDAPMDWNAVFVADRNLIFGLEMFKIFGQVLDFFTVCNVSEKVANWSHVSRSKMLHEFDATSCMTKTVAIMHL